jgi:DNA adenine methylase
MKSALKYHGGKHYLAAKIVALMPEHLVYHEGYAGGLSVLFAKSGIGVSEIVNDIDGDLTNFWRHIQGDTTLTMMKRRLEATPFSQYEFEDACAALSNSDTDPLDRACAYFIVARQSMAGRQKDFAPFSKTRLRSKMNEQVSAWTTAIEHLDKVHGRLIRVAIMGTHAPDAIRTNDSPKTLHYLDPTYLPKTRTAKKVYHHEMTHEQHVELLDLLPTISGKFMLSGYQSDLYDKYAAKHGWKCFKFDIANHAAGGASKRTMTECLYLNYEPTQDQIDALHSLL